MIPILLQTYPEISITIAATVLQQQQQFYPSKCRVFYFDMSIKELELYKD